MDPIGFIDPPTALGGRFGSVSGGAFGTLLQLVFQVLVMGAGIYALFNFILAGYSFMGAGDEPKKVEMAWAKIYQTIIGLAFVAGAFILGAIVGWLIFKDYTFLLAPTLPTI